MRNVVQDHQPTATYVLVIDDSATVLDVVERALARAGIVVETASGGRSGLEVAKARPPALVLLDHTMPDLTGAQVAALMQEDPALATVPLVVMSSRVHEAGEAFARQRSVVDFITKPFAPEALVSVVKHAIEKHAPGAAPRPRSPAEEAMDMAAEGAAPAERETGPALAGDLGVVTLPDVLWMLQRQVQTGVLRVSHRGARIELHLRDGLVDLATAAGTGDEFLLGRYLVAGGTIEAAALDALLDERRRAGDAPAVDAKAPPLLGADLIARGLIKDEDLKRALTRQTSELIFEALRWDTGRFELMAASEPSARAREASLGLSMDVLLMEGFRRIDEWRLIEAAIDSFDTVFVRHEPRVAEMANGRLTREEIAVLELVNGRNTVRDMTRQSRMGSFEVAKMLYRLLRAGVIRRRVPAVAMM